MKQATVLGACASYAAYCLFVGSAGIRTSPDSVFYLDFSPLYPAGYSLFLRLLGAQGAVIVQPLLFATALGWFGLEILRQWSSLPLALSAMAGCVAVPGLAVLHASIQTESVFMSCEITILALVTRFIRQPELRTAAIAAVVAGLASTVRNAGYVFLPVLLLMVILHWRRLRSPVAFITAIALPVIGLIAGERAVTHAVNGDQATSLLGRHMFAKAALIDAPRATPPLDPARTVIDDHLAVDFARIRQAIAEAPPSIQSLLTVYYETCLEGPCARQMRDTAMGSLPEATQNAMLANIALARIAQAPLNFARLTIRHYVALWVAYKQAHPNTTPILNEFLATHRPLPYEALAFSWRDPNRALQFEADERVRLLQPVVIAAAWITGALAVIALFYGTLRRMPPPLLAVASLSSLAAHAGVLFSATFAPGISRFTVSFWPAVMTGLVFAFWTLVVRGKRLRPGTA